MTNKDATQLKTRLSSGQRKSNISVKSIAVALSCVPLLLLLFILHFNNTWGREAVAGLILKLALGVFIIGFILGLIALYRSQKWTVIALLLNLFGAVILVVWSHNERHTSDAESGLESNPQSGLQSTRDATPESGAESDPESGADSSSGSDISKDSGSADISTDGDVNTLDTQTANSVSMVNVHSWGSGYQVDYQCSQSTQSSPLEGFQIQISYNGQGSVVSSWMRGYNGPFEEGPVLDDGSYGIRSVQAYVPPISSNSVLQFTTQVDGASFAAEDFEIDCRVN